MQRSKINQNPDDIELSTFARALALPIRVFIIRKVIAHQNALVKGHFADAPFPVELIQKHLIDLRKSGILEAQSGNGGITYRINKSLFHILSEKFSLFFGDIRNQNADQQSQASTVEVATDIETPLAFGAYIKRQRLSFQMTQQQLADQLDIERATLSKIENNKVQLPVTLLPLLSRIFYEDPEQLKKVYHSDQVAGMIKEGSINDDIYGIAKRKADR